MSTENNIVDTNEQNLDDFAAEFFSGKEAAPDPAKSESQKDTEEDVSNAPEEDDTHSDAEDESAEALSEEADTEDEDALASEEDDEEAEEDQPKKTRFQKRIDELTAKAREEERQRKADRLAFESRIAELEARLGQNDRDDKKESPGEVEGLVEPSPTEKLEDGSDKYPLGEYDPQYIKDMAKYTFDREFNEREAQRARTEEQKRLDAEKQKLQTSWTAKLGDAQERYPDFQQKGETLLDTFSGIDQSYGEYLSTTLMALDNGPDVLYYLASNPEEADAIVASGPVKATVALGKIDATFEAPKQNASPKPKVSKAPAPPPRNKGSAVAKASLNPTGDDVDLDALARELAKKSY